MAEHRFTRRDVSIGALAGGLVGAPTLWAFGHSANRKDVNLASRAECSPGSGGGACQRLDERRKMMQAWTDYLDGIYRRTALSRSSMSVTTR
jgi:hypothetical protein